MTGVQTCALPIYTSCARWMSGFPSREDLPGKHSMENMVANTSGGREEMAEYAFR